MEKFISSEELLYFCKKIDKNLLIPSKIPLTEQKDQIEILQKNAHLVPLALEREQKKLEKIELLMLEINTSLEELKFSIERKTLKIFNPNFSEVLSRPVQKALLELTEMQKLLLKESQENITLLRLIENYLKSF